MKVSVSNIAWGGGRTQESVETLLRAGVDGVELAPTAIWSKAPDVDLEEVRREAREWATHGLRVSAIQSLLYGRPDLQLFDPATHRELLGHLTAMVRIAGALGAGVAVFGSPRNRVRGVLDLDTAHGAAAEFFSRLLPVLESEGVVLAVEPNAPAYGADYLVHYEDCVRLAEIVGSPWLGAQVDTGCLAMVGDDVPAAIRTSTPVHVHMSAPSLAPPSDAFDHAAAAAALRDVGYGGWVTLEMLPGPEKGSVPTAAALLVERYGMTR